MTNGGDAAEQIVRLSLEGFEVAAKLTGSAAKNIAVLLTSVLKQEVSQSNKTRGRARLTNMIKSGKELKVFSLPQKDLQKFTEQAKKYGVLYCVLRDKNTKGGDVPIDIIARAEDASKIQRIVDRFELGKVDKVSIVAEAEKDVADREAAEKDVPTKTRGERIVEEAMGDPAQKEGNSIDYARNPEKTTEASRKKLHEIEGILDYAADEMKTEQCQYVTGINVNSVETAAKEFMHTKWMEGKTDGRVCFHGYQSFREGEVDAETAHKIGVALARELWGDRFQVIVATHCNTNHYHSHFVINSVSEADGKKFRNSPADYRRMREVSDRLCKEYGISVIKHPEGRGKNYGEVVAEREGKPTRRGIIKADLDRAIEASLTEQEFWAMLRQLGYEVKLYGRGGKPLAHPAIKPQGSERYFRLDRLGEGYSLDEIMGRVYRNRRRKNPMLDNRYALLFIRGERPIQDFKYDILKHPNVTLTTDGKAEPYQHGLDNLSIASIVFDKARQEQTGQEPEVDEDRYELISDEEIEEFLKQQEENEHEETQKT